MGLNVKMSVAVGVDSDSGSGLAAKIAVKIPGVERDKGRQLADATHATCLYSKATQVNIAVDVEAL